MSTLAVVEQVMREAKTPMSVRDIVESAGEALPTRSKTPDTVVARDLSMDIKKKGEESHFIRTSPGRYTMREFVTNGTVTMGQEAAPAPVAVSASVQTTEPTPILNQALAAEPARTLPASPEIQSTSVQADSEDTASA